MCIRDRVWTSDGSGVGGWEATAAANSVDGLSDAKSGGTGFTSSLLIGHQTHGTLDAADKNVGIGFNALDAITSGKKNVAVGFDALTANTTGYQNTVLGHQAGDGIVGGTFNVILGDGADTDDATATNQIVIGYDADGVADHSVTLGTVSYTHLTLPTILLV